MSGALIVQMDSIFTEVFAFLVYILAVRVPLQQIVFTVFPEDMTILVIVKITALLTALAVQASIIVLHVLLESMVQFVHQIVYLCVIMAVVTKTQAYVF